MIKFEHTEVVGWEAAIRGMRNPLESWEKSDSKWDSFKYIIGPNDLDLMKRLRTAGTDHRKYLRMIVVYVDITAPLYWWKEFDTYKVGTVANSCSTMHCIHKKEFTMDDFSHEHLMSKNIKLLEQTIDTLNGHRRAFIDYNNYVISTNEIDVPTKKDIWWQMIQLLPSSYNQKRTVMLNYEVLANIYKSRKSHKLDEWKEHNDSNEFELSYMELGSGYLGLCDWIKTLPYSELITGEFVERTEEKNDGIKIDWSDVPVDTPILVRNLKDAAWMKRYFAAFKNGRVYAWKHCGTSHTEKDCTMWRYAKLREEESSDDVCPECNGQGRVGIGNGIRGIKVCPLCRGEGVFKHKEEN